MSWEEYPHIETKNLLLRILEEKDESLLNNFFQANFAELSVYENTFLSRFNGNLKLFINCAQQECQLDTSIKWHLFTQNTNELLGMIYFLQIEKKPFYSCRLFFYMSPHFRGKGLMFEALKKAIRYIFLVLNIHRIETNYEVESIATESLLLKLGFEQEGRAYRYKRVGEKWQGHILTSLTNTTWSEV